MKKVLLYLSATALAMTMAACGSSDDDDNDDGGLSAKEFAKEDAERYCECMKINKTEGWSDDFDKCEKEYSKWRKKMEERVKKQFGDDSVGLSKFYDEYQNVLSVEIEEANKEIERYVRQHRDDEDDYNY